MRPTQSQQTVAHIQAVPNIPDDEPGFDLKEIPFLNTTSERLVKCMNSFKKTNSTAQQ